MKATHGFTSLEETAQALLEAPGVIFQLELKQFAALRREFYDGGGRSCLRLLTTQCESLNERFEAGYLIEMGRVKMYRDHTGQMVIDDDGVHEPLLN